MTWDDVEEPEVENLDYRVRCTVEITITIKAPEGSDECKLAELVEEYLDSDCAIEDPVVHGTPDIEDVN